MDSREPEGTPEHSTEHSTEQMPPHTPERTAAPDPAATHRSSAGRTSVDRRTFDPMAMIAGIFFMAIAVMYMLDAGGSVDARPGLMLALAVIGVGASGFVGAAWAMLSGRRAKEAALRDAAASGPMFAATPADATPVDLSK
ncbi:hypothetical protein [Yinghuangia soli]|uniref:Uncharacterized protein n=1 Tax=Yinghuangia soli TaxID=2908204 RepID=A0AA41Q1Y3_9ACTN|nr:hypothetical protein [Yinghuangia soli]MCF2530059.1 hypothetical protein [Yinghuangia soli]